MSHPTWVRGLKLIGLGYNPSVDDVAPYVGAWIESSETWQKQKTIMSHPTWVRGLKHHIPFKSVSENGVAPYVGAWIETSKSINMEIKVKVAPYVGAWIETSWLFFSCHNTVSHPTWVRGLKPIH